MRTEPLAHLHGKKVESIQKEDRDYTGYVVRFTDGSILRFRADNDDVYPAWAPPALLPKKRKKSA